MSKLFKLKEWLTVPDAARHLSIAFGEEVSEPDVLRLALDGHLKLSVNFVNHASAKRGKVIGWLDTEWTMFPSRFASPLQLDNAITPDKVKECPHALKAQWEAIPVNERLNYYPLLTSLNIDGERFLTLNKAVTTISGVWDLPMIGGERLDIEHAYQMMTNGPVVTLETLDGSFVERANGEVCQLQESFDDNEYQTGSLAQLERIKTRITVEDLAKAEAETLLNKHKEDRKKYLAHRAENKSNDYYPAGKLPEDAVYVIRTEELRKFERRIGEDAKTEKPLKTTERNTLLAIIAALCDYSDIKHQERGAAGQLAKMTDEIGVAVTDDTIRNVLSKIPDALESRKK